jgi:hypothetical protein
MQRNAIGIVMFTIIRMATLVGRGKTKTKKCFAKRAFLFLSETRMRIQSVV